MSLRARTASSATLRSFRSRNFRLFFGGQLISQIGNWLTLVAQSLFVLELTDSGVALGFLTAAQFLPVLVLGPWAGLVADRSDKQRLLITVQALAMVQSFCLAVLAAFDHPPLAGIYALALVGGVTTAFDNPARRSFVVEMVPEDDVQNAVSLNSALMTGSRIVGPALGGLLIITVGYSWCFAVDGISYAAVIYGLWRMNRSELRRPPIPPRAKGQVASGYRYARSTHDLWVPLVMAAAVGTFAMNFSVVLPLFVSDTFARSETTFTVLLSVLSVGSVIGALYTARRRTVSVHDVVIGSTAFGITMSLLAVVPWFGGIFPVGVLVGFTSVMFLTASTAIVQLRSEPMMRGRVLALQSIVFIGSTPIGGPIVGTVSEYVNPRAGVLLGGLACLAAAAWGHRRDLAHRAAEAAPVDLSPSGAPAVS